MSKTTVPANKRPDIQVDEAAVKRGLYAVLLTERQFNRDNTQFNDNTFVQYFTERDFQTFIGPRGLRKAYHEVEIVHDPTIKTGQDPVAEKDETPNRGGRPKKVV